jgi:DNA-binding NtrC family response regulator
VGGQDPADEDDTSTIQSSVGVTAPLGLVVSADGAFTTHPLPDRGELTVGRSRTCDVVIDHSSVSRQHAVVIIEGEQVWVVDQGSSNGTTLRGRRIAPGERIAVRPGDSFEVGHAVLLLRRIESGAPPRRVWPHSYFEARVEEEAARSLRSGRPFSLMRLSLAKQGPAGLLEDVFGVCLRAPDVVALYAPGELEVLLVETAAHQADAVAERVIGRFSEAGATVRVGLVCFPDHARSAAELMAAAHASVRPRGRAGSESEIVVGSDAAPMRRLRRLIDQVAPGMISVLILGETGVGKEVCAESIHRASPRAQKTFLQLNCAALPESLLESELFGHERGAFTGAVASKPGLIESADGGTVFLDEVGEMPLGVQAKLLRVLDSRQVMRVGGRSAKTVDVRFVAATNRNLEAEAQAGRFRSDLYYRLAGVVLEIPPLRQRVDEIVPLAEGFLARVAAEAGRPAPAISAEARTALRRYAWPGNIRELRNVIERAFLLCEGGPVETHHLPTDRMVTSVRPSALFGGSGEFDAPNATVPLSRITATELATIPDGHLNAADAFAVASGASVGTPSAQASAAAVARSGAATIPPPLRESMADLEKQRILDALAQCGGNQSAAAKLLGISRGTLIARLEAWGVARPRKRTSSDDSG